MNKDITQQELLITKELTGSISSDEQIQLNHWRNEDEVNEFEYQKWKQTWQKSEGLKAFQEEDAACAWQQCSARINFSAPSRNSSFSWVRQLAAVMVPALLMLGGYFTYQNVPGFGRLQAFSCGAESDSIQLKDNSVVSLASNSRLVFVKNFDGDKRLMELEGKGYFKVARDEAKPFIVSVGEAQVEVLGTQFNLSHDELTNVVELNVTEGKVRLSSEDGELIVIKGESAILDNGNFTKTNITNSNFLSWKSGKLLFEEDNFDSVLQDVKNHFSNIESVTVTGIKPSETITTKFVNPRMDDVLEELAIHFDKKIVFNDGKLLISD